MHTLITLIYGYYFVTQIFTFTQSIIQFIKIKKKKKKLNKIP
jgi:hypothetical protein